MTHVVIHRKPHPDGWHRWVRVDGRDYGVLDEGPGWGYQLVDVLTSGSVADGLFTLDDVRRAVAAGACAEWIADHQRTVACKLGVCLSCGTATDGRYYLCQSCDDDEAANGHTARVSERAADDGSRSAEPRSART